MTYVGYPSWKARRDARDELAKETPGGGDKKASFGKGGEKAPTSKSKAAPTKKRKHVEVEASDEEMEDDSGNDEPEEAFVYQLREIRTRGWT